MAYNQKPGSPSQLCGSKTLHAAEPEATEVQLVAIQARRQRRLQVTAGEQWVCGGLGYELHPGIRHLRLLL